MDASEPREYEATSQPTPETEALEPTGPPAPSPSLDSAAWGISSVLAIATGIFVAPAFLSVGRTAGATRSAQIEWERRVQLIAEAEEAAQQEKSPAADVCKPYADKQ